MNNPTYKASHLVKRRDELTAYNYAAQVANKIHSDEGAAQYGFRGALVPGVALYGYCTQAAVRQFGIDWLDAGSISARFAQPIYDAERIAIDADPAAASLNIRLLKPDGTVSTSAIASMKPMEVIDGPATAAAFEAIALPDDNKRLRPAINSFRIGQPLGVVQFVTPRNDAADTFARDMVDALECYRAPLARVHPALFLAQANRVLMGNIALGPWVHTASKVQHGQRARPGQALSMRARVQKLDEKRGHEIITLDILVLDESLQTVATIRHTAIIHLASKQQ